MKLEWLEETRKAENMPGYTPPPQRDPATVQAEPQPEISQHNDVPPDSESRLRSRTSSWGLHRLLPSDLNRSVEVRPSGRGMYRPQGRGG